VTKDRETEQQLQLEQAAAVHPEMKAGEGREREGPGHGTPGGRHGLNVEELAVATGLRYTEGRGKEIGINGA
jgi:hypothetical protein